MSPLTPAPADPGLPGDPRPVGALRHRDPHRQRPQGGGGSRRRGISRARSRPARTPRPGSAHRRGRGWRQGAASRSCEPFVGDRSIGLWHHRRRSPPRQRGPPWSRRRRLLGRLLAAVGAPQLLDPGLADARLRVVRPGVVRVQPQKLAVGVDGGGVLLPPETGVGEGELDSARRLGERVARLAATLKRGRTQAEKQR